jgi:hypothetical protein
VTGLSGTGFGANGIGGAVGFSTRLGSSGLGKSANAGFAGSAKLTAGFLSCFAGSVGSALTVSNNLDSTSDIAV